MRHRPTAPAGQSRDAQEPPRSNVSDGLSHLPHLEAIRRQENKENDNSADGAIRESYRQNAPPRLSKRLDPIGSHRAVLRVSIYTIA